MTEFSGFDEFADDLDDLADEFEEMADNAENLEGENVVGFDELFIKEFMRSHTDVSSFEAFLENSPWEVESQEDFWEIPEAEFDRYVNEHSDFDTWQAMLGKAETDWTARQIGLQ